MQEVERGRVLKFDQVDDGNFFAERFVEREHFDMRDVANEVASVTDP